MLSSRIKLCRLVWRCLSHVTRQLHWALISDGTLQIRLAYSQPRSSHDSVTFIYEFHNNFDTPLSPVAPFPLDQNDITNFKCLLFGLVFQIVSPSGSLRIRWSNVTTERLCTDQNIIVTRVSTGSSTSSSIKTGRINGFKPTFHGAIMMEKCVSLRANVSQT